MAFQGDSIYWVEVEKIVPNPYQPRREFDEGKLHELAESVRMYGVLQPLTVTRREIANEDGTFYTEYELIAGERRLRASKIAGLVQVPVIIRTGEQSNQEKLELAIIENLQREDLNAVDRALAFKQLAEQFNLSHALVAKKVGRSREYVSNTLRLLNLPEYMLISLKTGDITEGHGRTLLMLTEKPEEQDTLYREILLKKLSVREVERIARKIATDRVRKKDWGVDPVILEIEKRFTDSLGTRVQIQPTDYGGKLTIDYFTPDDLQKILDMIEGELSDQAEGERSEAVLENHTPLSFDNASDTDVESGSVPASKPAPEQPQTSEPPAQFTAAPTPPPLRPSAIPRPTPQFFAPVSFTEMSDESSIVRIPHQPVEDDETVSLATETDASRPAGESDAVPEYPWMVAGDKESQSLHNSSNADVATRDDDDADLYGVRNFTI